MVDHLVVLHYKKDPAASWESLYVGLESKGTKTTTDFSEIHFESQPQNESFFNNENEVEQKQTTYQLNNKFIISTIKSGMLVIDQHRAHQRVLYEDFLRHITIKEGVSQQLLFPLELHFSNQEIALLIN